MEDKVAILFEEVLPEGVEKIPPPESPLRVKPTTRLITVEPVLLLYCASYVGGLAILEEYINSRYQQNYPILNSTNPSGNQAGIQCNSSAVVNHSDPVFIATQMVQSDTSQLMIKTTSIFSVLAIFSTLFFGAYSDSYGRKRCLLLPLVAEIVVSILKLAIIYFDLPLELFCVGAAIEGLSGSWIVMLMATFAYIVDVTDQKSRAMRITIVETCVNLATALTQLALGYYVAVSGYFWPNVALFGLLVVDLIYLIFFVPESFVTTKETDFSVKKYGKATFNAYALKDGNRHIKLILLTLTMFFIVIPLAGRPSIEILYTMNIPLCWNTVLIGIFNAVYSVVVQIGAIAGVAIFGRLCHINDIWIATIGLVSATAAFLLNAFATTDVLMFLICPVGCLTMLTAPMIRTAVSRLVKPDELGSIFAGIAAVEATCNLISGTVLTLVYQETLYLFQGFIFLVFAFCFIVAFVLLCVYMVVSKSTGKVILKNDDSINERAVN